MLVVNPALPVKTLPELIAYAKANPDKLSHSSSGNGTLSHLRMEDFKRRAGIRIMHVPYQGSPRAVTDLVGGVVQGGARHGHRDATARAVRHAGAHRKRLRHAAA